MKRSRQIIKQKHLMYIKELLEYVLINFCVFVVIGLDFDQTDGFYPPHDFLKKKSFSK